ncbi:hypothetical protein CY34DRAFT_27258 [Suillus luteus UH-Slu-Lm8-n1]|uniref:Uncharacterized protein n=1 Tax=Suillus luteus UH-Slu-Lm8-n1 TaxID=930992 RepID=A0A0C9Z467_9AGAM|nr:hypothetical protein CY34DRAFT_27258 [Suillus luteus UH-Slu-Lm8-n1]
MTAAESSKEDPSESSDAKLERLSKDWTSLIYAFFKPMPAIKYHDKCRCHIFKFQRYLDKKDAKSTGNMQKHIKSCCGEPVLQAAIASGNTKAAQEGPIKSLPETGSIKTSFARKGKGKVTYSHHQHTCVETRAEVVHWVSESLRPFEIVND